MKNRIKPTGIIVFIAIIGFTFMSCGVNGDLQGKWQRVDNPNLIIEFQKDSFKRTRGSDGILDQEGDKVYTRDNKVYVELLGSQVGYAVWKVDKDQLIITFSKGTVFTGATATYNSIK
jgi:hypothetical protein